MKVICIKNNLINYNNDDAYQYYVTMGKEYDNAVRPKLSPLIWITNDEGCRRIYPADWFIPVEEIRDKKLEELGI